MLRDDKTYRILCLERLMFTLIHEPLEVTPSTCAGYMLTVWAEVQYENGLEGNVRGEQIQCIKELLLCWLACLSQEGC